MANTIHLCALPLLRSRGPRLLLLGCLAALVSSIPRPVSALACRAGDSICQQLVQAQNQQRNDQNQLKQIQGSLAATQQRATATKHLIQQISDEIASQKRAIANTQARLDETARQIRFTQADIARRQAEVAVRQQLLDQRVRSMDKQGPLDYFELIATSVSFSQLIDRIVLMQDVIRSDEQLVDQLEQDRDQVKQLEGHLQEQRAQQAALLAQQQQQEDVLNTQLAEQQAAMAYYQQLEAQLQQQAQALAAESAHLAALIPQLQAKYDAEARSEGGGSGRFAWPQQGVITQPFGCTDMLGEPYDPSCPSHHFHQGLDIAAPYGNTIGAGDSGVVIDTVTGCSEGVWWCGGGYGNHVVIAHGNGYSTLYAHLSAVLVSNGEPVHVGQPIGREGSTGYSTGPHLHFGVLYNGAWQNPEAYLP
jgi:murein DD-endopeptidase MepM/ murein hydrolase activator NlpD